VTLTLGFWTYSVLGSQTCFLTVIYSWLDCLNDF